jgi:peptidoglycan hydrolase-like protein with peptidoglycan-binding domain
VRGLGIFGVVIAVGLAVWPGRALASPQEAGVQIALRSLGLYSGTIDGVVGPETRNAVAAAQKRAHLPITGDIDTRTRDSLGPLGRPLFGKRTIEPGDFGLDVSVLQYLLARAGYYHGPLDGYTGPRLEAAIRAYQQHAKLSADGIAGRATLTRLVAGLRIHRPPPHGTYVVQSGDTLTAIAGTYGMTVAHLARANKLDPARALEIGTKLTVPAAPASAASTPTGGEPSLAATPDAVRSQLDLWAQRLGVPVALVRALAWMESGYQPGVVSSVGAQGVLQVMPSTRSFVEEVLVGHPLPQTLGGDIEVGVLYLKHLLDQFDGDTPLALGAWYQGERAVKQFGLYNVTRPFVDDVLALQARM